MGCSDKYFFALVLIEWLHWAGHEDSHSCSQCLLSSKQSLTIALSVAKMLIERRSLSPALGRRPLQTQPSSSRTSSGVESPRRARDGEVCICSLFPALMLEHLLVAQALLPPTQKKATTSTITSSVHTCEIRKWLHSVSTACVSWSPQRPRPNIGQCPIRHCCQCVCVCASSRASRPTKRLVADQKLHAHTHELPHGLRTVTTENIVVNFSGCVFSLHCRERRWNRDAPNNITLPSLPMTRCVDPTQGRN